MAGSGPAPSPNARRRNARPGTVSLPVAGRPGSAPAWPLEQPTRARVELQVARERALQLRDDWSSATNTRQARALAVKLETLETGIRVREAMAAAEATAEARLWADLWTTPQAVEWERMGWLREVAQYVRWKVKAEDGDLKAATEARQLSDRLGLTPLALLRLRWEIGNTAEQVVDYDDNVVELFG